MFVTAATERTGQTLGRKNWSDEKVFIGISLPFMIEAVLQIAKVFHKLETKKHASCLSALFVCFWTLGASAAPNPKRVINGQSWGGQSMVLTTSSPVGSCN